MGSEKAKISNDYFVKNIRALEKRVKKLENVLEEKHLQETITVEEVCKSYNISRSTFDRYRKLGLKVSQSGRNGKIMVKKSDVEKYLKNTKNG